MAHLLNILYWCADPLLDLMDKANVVRWRLFREACCPYEGNYVKVHPLM